MLGQLPPGPGDTAVFVSITRTGSDKPRARGSSLMCFTCTGWTAEAPRPGEVAAATQVNPGLEASYSTMMPRPGRAAPWTPPGGSGTAVTFPHPWWSLWLAFTTVFPYLSNSHLVLPFAVYGHCPKCSTYTFKTTYETGTTIIHCTWKETEARRGSVTSLKLLSW